MNVMFLGFAGSRREAILAESAQVARNGGRAAIVVDTFRPWKDEAVPNGVELIGVGALERDRPLMRFVDRFVDRYVVRAPDKLLRMVGRGPLRTFTRRLRRAYKNRVAKPIQGRATAVHRRLARPVSNTDLIMPMLRRGDFDYVIVANSQSIVLGAEIQDALTAAGATQPQIRFSADHLVDVPVTA